MPCGEANPYRGRRRQFGHESHPEDHRLQAPVPDGVDQQCERYDRGDPEDVLARARRPFPGLLVNEIVRHRQQDDRECHEDAAVRRQCRNRREPDAAQTERQKYYRSQSANASQESREYRAKAREFLLQEITPLPECRQPR